MRRCAAAFLHSDSVAVPVQKVSLGQSDGHLRQSRQQQRRQRPQRQMHPRRRGFCVACGSVPRISGSDAAVHFSGSGKRLVPPEYPHQRALPLHRGHLHRARRHAKRRRAPAGPETPGNPGAGQGHYFRPAASGHRHHGH